MVTHDNKKFTAYLPQDENDRETLFNRREIKINTRPLREAEGYDNHWPSPDSSVNRALSLLS